MVNTSIVVKVQRERERERERVLETEKTGRDGGSVSSRKVIPAERTASFRMSERIRFENYFYFILEDEYILYLRTPTLYLECSQSSVFSLHCLRQDCIMTL